MPAIQGGGDSKIAGVRNSPGQTRAAIAVNIARVPEATPSAFRYTVLIRNYAIPECLTKLRVIACFCSLKHQASQIWHQRPANFSHYGHAHRTRVT